MVVLSKLVLTTAVVVPALAFDLSHVRFGHPVHMLHEKAKAQKALSVPHADGNADASGTQHLGLRHVEERKVPTAFSEGGIVKHNFHHSQDVLEPRDATAADSTAGAADASTASADTAAPAADAGAAAGGAPDPAHEAHKDATANDATSHDAAHDPASPATPAPAVNAAAAPPASHSSSAAAATNTQKVTPHKPQGQNNDFFGGLLKLIFHEPNHVDKALSNGWDAMGKLFTGQPSKSGAPAQPASATHHRRFELEDSEELFERDFPEEDLELFERDLPEEDLELFERSFPEDMEELEARDFDEELEQLAARAFDDDLELEARDFDDELELEARDFDEELELEARDFDDLEDLE